jgi:hypothetical protein
VPCVTLAVAVDVEVGDDDRVAVEVGEVVDAGEAVEVAEAFGVGEEVEVGVEVVVEVGEGVEVVVGVGVLVVVEVGEGVEVAVGVGDGVVVVVGVAVEVVEAVGDGVLVVVWVGVFLGDRLPRVADVVYEAEGAARARELLRTASNPASENKSNVIESTPAKAHVAFSLLHIQKFNRRVLYEPASRLFFIFASFDRHDSNSQGSILECEPATHFVLRFASAGSQGRLILFRPATDCVLASPSRSER